MSESQLHGLFPDIPRDRFLVHDFRDGVRQLEFPASFVRHVSDGKVDYAVPCQVNRELISGNWDRIISIGQLVPHEVIGIANHVKNVFVGTVGKESIDRSHFLGAVCGMEAMMGRPHTPVRDVLNYMSAQLAPEHLSPTFARYARRTRRAKSNRGLYCGDDEAASWPARRSSSV